MSSAPTFDDVEKTLQLLGLINTLMLGCVSGSIADSGGTNGTNLEPADEAEFLRDLYQSFVLYSCGMLLIFCMYFNLVLSVEEKKARDAESQRAACDAQVRFVWFVQGRLLFLIVLCLEVAASATYFGSMNVYLRTTLEASHWNGQNIALVFYAMVYLAHLPFMPLHLSKIQREEQLLNLPELPGFACCPSLVRDFTKQAQIALVEFVPPSQRS